MPAKSVTAGAMATDFADMIAHLHVFAAMLMEDASAVAASSASTQCDHDAILGLRNVGADIATLLAAAEVIDRHFQKHRTPDAD